jgi:hypothetical protein
MVIMTRKCAPMAQWNPPPNVPSPLAQSPQSTNSPLAYTISCLAFTLFLYSKLFQDLHRLQTGRPVQTLHRLWKGFPHHQCLWTGSAALYLHRLRTGSPFQNLHCLGTGSAVQYFRRFRTVNSCNIFTLCKLDVEILNNVTISTAGTTF